MKKRLFTLVSALMLSSCGTLTSLDKPCPYSGVRQDAKTLTGYCGEMGCIAQMVAMPFVLIDMPLSLVLDTALLPVQGVRYSNAEDKKLACKMSSPWGYNPYLEKE